MDPAAFTLDEHCRWLKEKVDAFTEWCERNACNKYPNCFPHRALMFWDVRHEGDPPAEAVKRIEEICTCRKKRHHEGNGTYSGPFAFTLTKSPTDAYTVGDMLTAVRKLMKQKSCPVKKYAWYYEEKGRDENGDPIHPHIHGMYETETGGRIETKHFKRAWPIWDPSRPLGAGFRGGYHRPIRAGEAYDDYISKDGGMSERTE